MEEGAGMPVSKSDLNVIEKRITEVEHHLTTDIKAVEHHLTTDIKAVEHRLTTDIKAVEQRLTTDIKAVEQRLTTDIKSVERRLAAAIVRVEGQQKDIKEAVIDMIRQSQSKILNALDALAAQFVKLDRRQILTSHDIAKIDARLSRVESK